MRLHDFESATPIPGDSTRAGREQLLQARDRDGFDGSPARACDGRRSGQRVVDGFFHALDRREEKRVHRVVLELLHAPQGLGRVVGNAVLRRESNHEVARAVAHERTRAGEPEHRPLCESFQVARRERCRKRSRAAL